MPTTLGSVSAVIGNEYPVSSPVDSSSMLVASSPLYLSGSTFPDSDTGYFGSTGLYEGSCDHLELYCGRRYSAELTDDTEVFDEGATEIPHSQIPVDSCVAVSCERQSAMPSITQQLETSNKELSGVATVDANLQSSPTPHVSNEWQAIAAATDLSAESQKTCRNENIPANDMELTAVTVGLSEVAGKYSTIQLLLDMNQQRACLGNAVLDLPPGSQSSTCSDREALSSLATNYSVINECLHLGRAVSKHSKSDDNSMHDKPLMLTSDCSEQPQADLSHADVTNIAPVEYLGSNLPHDDAILCTYDTQRLGENISAAVFHDTDEYKADGKPAVSQSELGLMYMATEDTHYYPVHSRLQDLETGVFNSCPHVADRDIAMDGSTTEIVALDECEQIQRINRDTCKDNAESVSISYTADTALYLDQIIARLELSVVHYGSVTVLNDVESGNLSAFCMPAHRTVDGKSLSKQKLINVSEGEAKNGEVFDEDRCGLAELDVASRSDGYRVVETKKQKGRRKKELENAATENLSAPFNDSDSGTVHSKGADNEEMHTDVILEAEKSTFGQSLTSKAGAEEYLMQNSSVEISPCIDEISAAPVNDLSLQTNTFISALATEKAVTGMLPEHDGLQISETIEEQLDLTISIGTETAAGAAKQETFAEVSRQLDDQNLSGDVVPTDIETVPVSVVDDKDENKGTLSDEGVQSCVAVEDAIREQEESGEKTMTDDTAGMTETTVTVVAPEPPTTAVAVPEVAFRDASELPVSASNETVRLERLITVAPKSVVRVTLEPCGEIPGRGMASVANTQEPAVITESPVQVEHEPNASTVERSICEPVQAAVESSQAPAEGIAEAAATVLDATESESRPTELANSELKVTLSESVVDKAVVEVAGYSELIASPLERNAAENEANLYAGLVGEKQKEETVESSNANTDIVERRETMKTFTEMEAEPKLAVEAVEQVEAGREMDADAISKMKNRQGCETVDSLNLSEISQIADVHQVLSETKIARTLCDEVKTERGVAHYVALAVLGDVESGKVHNRLKASRLLQEWGAENVDDVVAYIAGSEAKKQRRKHKHLKRTSESEVSELKAPEHGSDIVTISMRSAKSEENIAFLDERREELDAVVSDVEDQNIEESEDETEGGSFMVVESRKHRRQRHRHDTEEMWAQYLEDVDTGPMIEQSERESFAESQHGPAYMVAETGVECAADSSDVGGVVDRASETMKASDETVTERVSDTDVETMRDALEAVTAYVSAEYVTEARPTAGECVLGLEHDAKQDSSVEDSSEYISAEIRELVTESIFEVVPRSLPEVEIDKYINAVHSAAASQPLERTVPASDGCVVRGVCNRLYSDVARGMHDVDAVAKPGRETPTTHDEVLVRMDVRAVSVETLQAASVELPVESEQDVSPKLASEAECQSSAEVPVSFSVTLSPETSQDAMVGDAGEFVNKRAEDARAELISEITPPTTTFDVTWPVAETTESAAQPTDNSLELPFTEGAVELNDAEPAAEQRQQKAVAVEKSVPVVDLKSDVELSAAEHHETVSSIQAPANELPRDVQILTSANGIEPLAAEPNVQSHTLISCTEVSDVGAVSEANDETYDQLESAENLELSCIDLTEAPTEGAVELPALDLQSTEHLEPGVTIPAGEAASTTLLHTLDVQSIEEPYVKLPVTEDVPIVGCEAVTEDEQRVADLFSEGARAVQIRSHLASAAGVVIADGEDEFLPDSLIEITDTRTVSRNEDTLKKSAILSAESFITEILPYYYAALAVLREVERDTMQLPGDPSLRIVEKEPVEMSRESTMTNDAGVFTVSAGDERLSDAVPVERTLEMESAAETVLIDSSQPHEYVVSDSTSKQSAELLSETLRPTAGKGLHSGLQLDSTIAASEKRLSDYSHTDVVASQCYYQSLQLLHSLEAGNLPVSTSKSATDNDLSSITVERAPVTVPVKQPTDESSDTLTFSSVAETRTPCHDILKDVSMDDNDVHGCAPKISSRSAPPNFPAAEDLTAAISSAEHSDVELNSPYDLAAVAQPVHENHAEHEHNDISISTIDEADDSFAEEAVELNATEPAVFNLLAKEPTPAMPGQTGNNMNETDIKRSQPNVLSPQEIGDGENNDTASFGATDESLQSPMRMNEYSPTDETVSTDVTEDLLPSIHFRELLQQQQPAEPHAKQDASCFDEQSLGDANVDIAMSIDSKTFAIQEPPEEKTKKKRRNRKKKPKSPKDDLAHVEASPGRSDLPSVNQGDNFCEIVSENFSPAAEETGNFDDIGLQATNLVNSEAPDGIAASSPKKKRKRKRTKKSGQAGADNMSVNINKDTDTLSVSVNEAEQNILNRAEVSSERSVYAPSRVVAETAMRQDEVEAFHEAVNAHSCPEPLSVLCSKTVGFSSANTDDNAVGLKLPDRTPNVEQLIPSVLPEDVTAASNKEEDGVKKLVELHTNTVDGASVSSTKPAKRKNRKKRKPKTGTVPPPGDPVIDNEASKVCDNSVSLDSLAKNREQLDGSAVAEADEIMTESLEEDTRITEQPLDILSMDESKGLSDPSAHHFSPVVSKTSGKKKRKRKTKASKVEQPSTTAGHDSDFVTESLLKAKDDPSVNDVIVDEPSVSNFGSESAKTDVLTTNLTLTTGHLDSTNVSLSISREDKWKEAEKETPFEMGSDSESSLDEYQLHKSNATEPAADSTTLSEFSKKRKKKRRRNKQKKLSQTTTCPDAETDTDLCSLLTRIIEICLETKDSQAADSGSQTQCSSSKAGKHDTNTSHTVHTQKAARKPRKYKRSKPIRLPPDAAERPEEPVSSVTDKTSADTTSSSHGLQSPDSQNLSIDPATKMSEEAKPNCLDSLKFPESPTKLASTEGVLNLSDSAVADDRTVMENVEERDTIIAWSASMSKTKDSSSPLPGPVLADAREDQLTGMSQFTAPGTQSVQNTVGGTDYLTICPSDETQTKLQETCQEDEPSQTSDAFQDGVISQNIVGCLTADVFTVLSENTDVGEASDAINFTSEPNADSDIVKPLTVVEDDQQVPEADNNVGIIDQNSNHYWFDGGGLLQAPTSGCETSSVDSEVERIFAGHMAGDVRDSSSVVEEGVSSDSGKYADDDELALDDDDLVVTEYVDVEIIEETETITVIDNDDDLSPSSSDRHYLDTDDAPPGSKYIISGDSPPSASGRVQETAEDVMQFRPRGFRLHDDEDKCQLTGLLSDVDAKNMKLPVFSAEDPSASDNRGQKFSPQWFSNYSVTGNQHTFHCPPVSEERTSKSEFPELPRFSRKRHYPSDDTSSSDSVDIKPGTDDSQFVIAQHHPASSSATFAPYPAWPFLASDTQWSASGDVLTAAFSDAIFGEQNPERELQVIAKPGPMQNVAHAVPTDFELQDGSNVVRRAKDFSQDDDGLSSDSLNEEASIAVGGFFDELKTSTRTTTSSGEKWQSCSTDSLDYQTKIGYVIEPSDRRRSSTDCISEDSLAESSFVHREDSGSLTANKHTASTESTNVATTTSTQVAEKQGQNASRVRPRPKKLRGVSARFKCPKPGVAVKTNRKRKMGNVTKDDSEGDETDTDDTDLQ